MESSAVQLVFAGEVLDGFDLADVKQRLAQRLKLGQPRLRSLFSGQRVVRGARQRSMGDGLTAASSATAGSTPVDALTFA